MFESGDSDVGCRTQAVTGGARAAEAGLDFSSSRSRRFFYVCSLKCIRSFGFFLIDLLSDLFTQHFASIGVAGVYLSDSGLFLIDLLSDYST